MRLKLNVNIKPEDNGTWVVSVAGFNIKSQAISLVEVCRNDYDAGLFVGSVIQEALTK